MSSDALRKYLHRTPFQPVMVLLPSGRTVTVSNPRLTMFNETGRTLIVAEGERIILIDVATVEALETVGD